MCIEGDQVALATINSAVGPAPWYWTTFPSLRSRGGTQFNWFEHGKIGERDHFIGLRSITESLPRLIIGTHVRAFTVPNSGVGIWFQEHNLVRILVFDPDDLPCLAVPVGFARLGLKHHSGTGPVVETEIPIDLPAGSNRVEIPGELSSLDELLTVHEYTASQDSDVRFGVLSIRPRRNEIVVMPQRWFSKTSFNEWQWITRIARHPTTGILLGDGVRLFQFALTEDGCELACAGGGIV